MLPALLLALVAVVHNDLPFARQHETVEIPASQLGALGDLNSIHVFDGEHELVAQTLDIDGKRSLIFQTDVPANGTRSLELSARQVVCSLSEFFAPQDGVEALNRADRDASHIVDVR